MVPAHDRGGAVAYPLKRIPHEGIERALDEAERCRTFQRSEEAESICRDVLALEANHPRALELLGLALTDQFPRAWSRVFDEVLAVFERLPDERARVYHAGLAYERLAGVQLAHGQARTAVASLETALDFYERAEKLASGDGKTEPVLRWNRCVRMLSLDPELREACAADRPPALPWAPTT